jgi:hypothetical protein
MTKSRVWALLQGMGARPRRRTAELPGLPTLTKGGAALLEAVRRLPLEESDDALEKLEARIRQGGRDAARLSIAMGNRLEAQGRHHEAARIARRVA